MVAVTSVVDHHAAVSADTVVADILGVAWALVAVVVVVVVVAASSMSPMFVPAPSRFFLVEECVDLKSTAPIQCRMAGFEGPLPSSWYVPSF